jgi:hypothetical protein
MDPAVGHTVKKSGEIDSTCFQITRLLEPVKAIQVLQPDMFVIGQSDGNGVFMDGDEFERAVVIIMDSFVGEVLSAQRTVMLSPSLFQLTSTS